MQTRHGFITEHCVADSRIMVALPEQAAGRNQRLDAENRRNLAQIRLVQPDARRWFQHQRRTYLAVHRPGIRFPPATILPDSTLPDRMGYAASIAGDSSR